MSKTGTGKDAKAEKFAEPAEPGSGSDDDGVIDLDPGDDYVGEITGVDFSAGSHGVLEVDGKTVWLNGRMLGQLLDLIEGEPVLYEKSENEESFTDDDGETVTYNPRNLRFVE